MSYEVIYTVLRIDCYQEMKDSVLFLSTRKKDEISIESLRKYLDEGQNQRLKPVITMHKKMGTDKPRNPFPRFY